jgi:hypothetical protein
MVNRSSPAAKAVQAQIQAPRPAGGPGFEQGVLAERQVSHRKRPGEQAAGDRRAPQPDAGDPDDVPGDSSPFFTHRIIVASGSFAA